MTGMKHTQGWQNKKIWHNGYKVKTIYRIKLYFRDIGMDHLKLSFYWRDFSWGIWSKNFVS